jgi:hypothetical protein
MSQNDFKTDELLESITGFQKRFGSKGCRSENEYIQYCITNMTCLNSYWYIFYHIDVVVNNYEHL